MLRAQRPTNRQSACLGQRTDTISNRPRALWVCHAGDVKQRHVGGMKLCTARRGEVINFTLHTVIPPISLD
jgi:hypothetical protein